MHTHLQGKTAYNLAMENQNRYGMDIILMGRQKTEPQNMWEYITRNRVSLVRISYLQWSESCDM